MTEQIAHLPDALEQVEALPARLRERSLAVFLDFDGTLAPIVTDPAAAEMPQRTKVALVELARRCPVAIVSGRDLEDVMARAGVEGVVYAGSHGLDIAGPSGRHTHGEEHLDELDTAQATLERELLPVDGARVERKRFALAVHHREVSASDVAVVQRAVAQVAAQHPRLRRTGGKQVLELRPDVTWDKGHAVLWLLEAFGLERDHVVPVYVGDDLTDEDAFAALSGRGFCVVVRGEDDARLTAASASLVDTAAVGELLERLTKLLDDDD